MKKESIKKKLSFKKTFVANLNENAAQTIVGGENNTSLGWPCNCAPDTHAPNICYSQNCPSNSCPPDTGRVYCSGDQCISCM
ncbi:MAG: class I lanthipeptide [Lewinellaceae bacterium]|nr:class I lanthipeptide [Lewinellaceae bacterium]